MKNFQEFISQFLSKRNLKEPDARPLYGYKISNGRYNALKVLLQEYWENSIECNACFVLYSVEFLRAESHEGHLRWDYIFNSILKSKFNNPQSRTKIIESGLLYWKRDVFRGQNREFLETLRFESGLPNSSLNDNNNLSSLIKSTFQLVESYKLLEEDLIPLIQEKIEKHPIPAVLQQKNFYGLVVQLCFKFLEFKEKFDLSNQPNPTEYLQDQLTSWRTEMPLKIEGDRMNDFFNRMISDISKLKKLEPLALDLETILTEDSGGHRLKTFLTIPKGVYSHEALGLKEEEFNKLPGYFSLNLEIDGKVKYLTSFTKLSSNKISARGLVGFQIPVDLVNQEWFLSFTSDNLEVRIETELSKYFKVRSTDLLVFIEDNQGNWVYRGSGPLKIKDSRCKLLMDESRFSINNLEIQKTGETVNGLSVFQVGLDCLIHDIENQTEFWIRMAQEIDSNKVLDFSQSKLPESGSFDFLKENHNLFLGFPRVYLLDRKLGLKEIFLGTVEVLNEHRNWDILNPMVFGRKRFRFKDRNGNILGVKILNILPSDFKVNINSNNRLIEFYSEQQLRLLRPRNGVESVINSTGQKTVINIDPVDNDSTKTFIGLGLDFHNGDIMKINVPNPNFTEIFVNGDGEVLERSSYSLSNIHGLSITINNYKGIAERKTYTLKLFDIHDHEASSLVIKKEFVVNPNSTKILPLYQWGPSINQLFSLTKNTRSKVRIASSKPHHYIEISKYELDLIYDPTSGILSTPDQGVNLNISLSAFRLDNLFNSDDLVDLEITNNNYNIIKALPYEGIWFVFSKSDSSKTIFPKVIIKGGINDRIDDRPIQYLWEGSLMGYDQRIARFKEFFDNHYLNFDHPVWKELHELYKITEHLPISAMDVWKGLVKSPKGMLTFFFSLYADSTLIQKVSQELGFIWQLVPIFRWKEVFSAWVEQMQQSEIYYKHVDIFKSTKLSIIKNELGLDGLIDLLNQNPQAISVPLLGFLMNSDINGEEGKLGIRTRNPDGVYWASYVGEFIIEKFKQLPEDLKNILPNGLLEWQKPVIYLPVIMAYHSVNRNLIKALEFNPEILLGIKLNMDFDKTYFDDVYSKVQGFCFTQYYYNPNNT